MTLVSMPSPIFWPGIGGTYTGGLFLTTAASLSSAGHYYCFVFVAKEDMVISHVGIRASTATGSPTLTVSIEGVDPATGLPNGTATYGGSSGTTGTVTTNSNVLQALGGSATVPKGSVFAVKIALASGTSQLLAGFSGQSSNQFRSNFPYLVLNTGTPTKSIWSDMMGTLALGSSSTTFYQIVNCIPASAGSSGTFNNTSSAKRGLRFTPPMNCRAIGIRWFASNSTGDYNAILFNDAGTELSSSSTAFDGDFTAAAATGGYHTVYFDNTVTLTAGTTYRAAIEPTSATNVGFSTITLVSSSYLGASPLGSMGHYTLYTGTWDDTNTAIIPILDVILDQIDNGSGSGGGGGVGMVSG